MRQSTALWFSSLMGEMTMMSPWMSSDSILDGIALTIASFLEALDLCCLGSYSKFRCDLCASDPLWLALTKKRWPHLSLEACTSSLFLGWKSFYISKHKSLACFVSVVIKYVEQCTLTESIEVGYCFKAITGLRSVELGFKDVQMFMLARKHSVLLNLIGLQYCICFLGISQSQVSVLIASSGRRCDGTFFCVTNDIAGYCFNFKETDEGREKRRLVARLCIESSLL